MWLLLQILERVKTQSQLPKLPTYKPGQRKVRKAWKNQEDEITKINKTGGKINGEKTLKSCFVFMFGFYTLEIIMSSWKIIPLIYKEWLFFKPFLILSLLYQALYSHLIISFFGSEISFYILLPKVVSFFNGVMHFLEGKMSILIFNFASPFHNNINSYIKVLFTDLY